MMISCGFIKKLNEITYCMVSKSIPRIPESGHLRNTKTTCPMMKQMPTNTFHPRSGLGPGLNLLIINPDNKNPNIIPINVMGAIKKNNKKITFNIYGLIYKAKLIFLTLNNFIPQQIYAIILYYVNRNEKFTFCLVSNTEIVFDNKLC